MFDVGGGRKRVAAFACTASRTATCLILLVGLSGGARVPDGAQSTLRSHVMRLLEDIEQTRLLLGITMWQVHDLRNFALYGQGDVQAQENRDRQNLRLYEKLKPLDYGASSLLAAVDLRDDTGTGEDLDFLRAELGRVAGEVLRNYRAVTLAHERTRKQLLERAGRGGMKIKRIAGLPWRDPIREQQRKIGVQIGWQTSMEPPADFRESFWNRLQQLDVHYQLKKGKSLGLTFLVFKDPVLRWDRIEQQEGRYDFAAFDRMMKLAAAYGMKVKLVLPTMGGGVPDWWVQKRPEAAIHDAKGNIEFTLSSKTYSHDFLGPIRLGSGHPWYQSRAVNLADAPTRERFAQYVQALARHCLESGYTDRILAVNLDLFYGSFANGQHWRVPSGVDPRRFVLEYFEQAGRIVSQAFPGIPMNMSVANGEPHAINNDRTAHEWRSAGLTRIVGIPAVDSETPFFEDLMRAVALEDAKRRVGPEVEAGPFFYQNCEYGFGTMLSINFFTSLLRDGLWSDGWFGPEGILRWAYLPQIFTYNDRQLQWSAITNIYLGYRQAHLLGPTVANTRVTPADVLLLLPSSSLDSALSRTNRELVGWGWGLTALKIPYDVLTEAGLARGVPERAKLLILPQAMILGEAHLNAIREFVRSGGLLVSSLVPGSDGTHPSPLSEVTGCDLSRPSKEVAMAQTGVKGTWLQRTVPRGMHSGRYQPVPAPDTGYPRQERGRIDQAFQSLQPVEDARVMARYLTGEPAVVEHRFGKGKALTLGYSYGHELMTADWTSLAFGKIYNGWARDEQIIGMVRWLRDTLLQFGYIPRTEVPEAWRHRHQNFEAAATSLSYPKGAEIGQPDQWPVSLTYLDPRPDHRVSQDHDEMDYAAELTWRDRPGINTRYLALANRESAYGGERGVVQFWVMPHIFLIRINEPSIRQVYDVAAGAPVLLERDAQGVSFRTSAPPALGRVFAVSNDDTIELFEGAGFPGLSFTKIAENVSVLSRRKPVAERSQVVALANVLEWLEKHRSSNLLISYGNAEYRVAAEKLADWLRERYAIAAKVTGADGQFESKGRQGFEVRMIPSPAEILIGNSWSNNTIATLDSTWPYNAPPTFASMSGRLTATYEWPGGERGIVTVARRLELRREDHTGFGGLSGDDPSKYAPRDVNTAPEPYRRQRLLVLASTPAGALNGVGELVKRAADR